VIKWIFRWAFRLFLLFLVLVIAFFLLLDTFARELVEYQLSNQTGMETRVGKVRVGLLHPQVTIENLVIYNSAEFGGSPFIEMPEIHVEYDRDSLLAHKLRCRLLRFNLSRINLVEDKKGRRNFDVLQSKTSKLLPPKTAPGAKARTTSASDIQFAGIDTLNLSLGKVTYLRMTAPGKPDEFKLNVDHQVFTGIKSEADFQSALMVSLLKGGVNLYQSGASGQTLLQLFSPPKK